MRKLSQPFYIPVLYLVLFLRLAGACQELPPPKQQEIVPRPELLNEKTQDIIRTAVAYAAENQGILDDTLRLYEYSLLRQSEAGQTAARIWSDGKDWLQRGNDCFTFIEQAEQYGLYPTAYHVKELRSIRNRLLDSTGRTDAAVWARGELLMTDAFIRLGRHLKLGRLGFDSVSLRSDTLFDVQTVNSLLNEIREGRTPTNLLQSLEPRHPGYIELKNALPAFLDSMDRLPYTYIDFPYKDSLKFVKQLQSRLFENAYITFNTRMPDSAELTAAVRKAQVARGLQVDGKAGPALVRSLNHTSQEKFNRIAINLDRYKQLQDTMPVRYIWVNLPAFRMELKDSGLLVLESKVIVGQPKTRTPVLNSEVTNFITYPQWTVPYSIIFKEMLPKIQQDIHYLDKQNLMVVDKFDSVIDPATIDWSRLSKKYFPYNLKQREGDDNSLGVIKFNFRNKYSVYLHDTNARGLFSRSNRAMSHGCVRLQKWDSLANYLVSADTLACHPDTLKAWIKRGEKHQVFLKNRIPIFLRYYTAYVKEGRIQFYEDIYAEDKYLRMSILSRNP
jgi:murein L,D-transpeptidase YcbB/YkuD